MNPILEEALTRSASIYQSKKSDLLDKVCNTLEQIRPADASSDPETIKNVLDCNRTQISDYIFQTSDPRHQTVK